MPKKNEHGDVFLRVCIYEKCSYHNHKTIKQHSKQTNTPRAIPPATMYLQRTKAIGSLRGYFAVKERSFPVFLLIFPVPVWCFHVGDSWSCCLVLLPGPAWSCLIPAAWSGLVLSDPAWFVLVLSGYLACRILVVPFSKIQQRPAANSRWAG